MKEEEILYNNFPYTCTWKAVNQEEKLYFEPYFCQENNRIKIAYILSNYESTPI